MSLPPPKVRGTMPTSQEYPLLLAPFLDRGCLIQPETEIITKTADGYYAVTYLQHRVEVSKAASALRNAGVGEGDVVSSFCWNNARHFVMYHAIPGIGSILGLLNIRLSDQEIAWIIQDSGTKVLVVDEDLVPKIESTFAAHPDKVSGVQKIVVCGLDGGRWVKPTMLPRTVDWDAFLATGDPNSFPIGSWPRFSEDSACFLCYTSGTTGNPKGVAYSHRSTYVHVLLQMAPDVMNISGADTLCPVTPMFHAACWGVPLVAQTLGCRIVLVNRFMSPPDVATTIIEKGVTLSSAVPTVWQSLKQALLSDPSKIPQVKGVLKTLICGGSAPPYELMMWYLNEMDVRFRHIWGMTEMGPLGTLSSFVQRQRDVHLSPEERAQNLISQGINVPTVEMKIVDSEDMSVRLPNDGETAGELLVQGPSCTVSYWKGAGPDKFIDGQVKTGDVASLSPSNVMKIRDRSKDVVKSGGEFISSIDLENAITGLPSVVAACVVAVPHPKWDERPVVIVVTPEGVTAPSRAEVCKYLETSQFAKFQWPDDVIHWKEIPMTGTGKMDKKEVRAILQKDGYLLPDQRRAVSKL